MKNNVNVVCIENSSLNSMLLITYLKRRTSVNCSLLSLSAIESEFPLAENALYFLSFSAAITLKKPIDKLTERHKQNHTIIYDAPVNISTYQLTTLGRLKGYFSSNISRREFILGVNTILSGESFLPNKISSQLIEYYQSLIVRFSEPHNIELTQREVQVLQYLRFGLSNNKLADALFVSEHTIKSHLYKIFKKLSVSNRTQAIAWANRYLP